MTQATNPFEGVTVRKDAPEKPEQPPASDKQVRFIRSLIRDRETLLTEVPDDLTKALASKVIDSLLAAPKRQKPEAKRVPEGIHYLDDTVFKVQTSQTSGKRYAKRLTKGGSWDYVGREPLGSLSEDTLMTLEDAEEYGQLYGVCAICGAVLSNEDSIARGIGPICAQRF